MTVDPRVVMLAEIFVDHELRVLGDGMELDPTIVEKRRALVERAAAAMQQAIEHECAAIRQELNA